MKNKQGGGGGCNQTHSLLVHDKRVAQGHKAGILGKSRGVCVGGGEEEKKKKYCRLSVRDETQTLDKTSREEEGEWNEQSRDCHSNKTGEKNIWIQTEAQRKTRRGRAARRFTGRRPDVSEETRPGRRSKAPGHICIHVQGHWAGQDNTVCCCDYVSLIFCKQLKGHNYSTLHMN